MRRSRRQLRWRRLGLDVMCLNEETMDKFAVHECQYQDSGIRIEFSRSYFHEHFTWQLVVTREATELDLEMNHELEQVGDQIWSTVIEINNCPYCGEKLRRSALDSIEYAHFDSSGWEIDVT